MSIDYELIDEILEGFDDKILIDIENGEEGYDLLEIELNLPKEVYRKYGPESIRWLEEYINYNPYEFCDFFFPGIIKDMEWGDIEKEFLSVRENQGSIKMNLNICCKMKDD